MSKDRKYNGKTLNEWKKDVKKDEVVGIRTKKYVIVLEELVDELLSKLNYSMVISSVCISCDEQKETHELCMDCVKKMIDENQKTSLQ
jgi:ribosomal protein L32